MGDVDAGPPAVELFGRRDRCTTAAEGVEDRVPRVGRGLNDSLQEERKAF